MLVFSKVKFPIEFDASIAPPKEIPLLFIKKEFVTIIN